MGDGFRYPYGKDESALPRPRSTKTLWSRGLIPDSYVQAFLWVDNCTGTTNPAWHNLNTTQCYTFTEPGANSISRMYSANVSVPGARFVMYRDDSDCQNGYTYYYPDGGGACYESADKRGWMSFAVQLEETVSSVQTPASTAYSTTSSATAGPTASTQTGVKQVP